MSLPLAAAPCFADLGGMAFLDDAFNARRLLAMTAALRHVDAGKRGIETGISDRDIEAWLAPSRAYLLGAGHGPMPALPLPPGQQEQVTGSLSGIAALIPAWAELVRLPVRYASLYPPNGAISASSTLWPQHVLLAEEAFASRRELREQIVHELAHQWLYLIQAIWPLDQPGAAPLTLPSGTAGRTPAEVLGAAHVAAALSRLYQADGTPWAAARIQALTAYGTGCVQAAESAGHDLTPTGNLIAQRLKEALTTVTRPSPARPHPLMAWGTPVFQADFPGADRYNPDLKTLIMQGEQTDPEAALFGGINAVKSSSTILTWDHPAIGWFKARIMDAVTALTEAELGDAAREVTHGIQAEAWAVVYRHGGSLRPHTHHDSAWSGVYYVEAGNPGNGGTSDAGYLQLLDPRPGAIARQASAGSHRIRPAAGRMVAFPGWLPHSVQATASDDSLRIAIAWNVAYDKTWRSVS